jgi:SagB-type dehydrogenase family enzyme
MAKEIKLPEPRFKGEMSIEEALSKRRSIREFKGGMLSLGELSQLLWAAQGITEKRRGFRTAPSAGALYPMEVYLLTKDGFYYYKSHFHCLEVIKEEDLRRPLGEAALSQSSIAQAQANFLICAVYDRITFRYGERGIRYAHIETGHIAQNIHLQALALGLGSVPIGAFDDVAIKKLLNLPENHDPIYIIPVGYLR